MECNDTKFVQSEFMLVPYIQEVKQFKVISIYLTEECTVIKPRSPTQTQVGKFSISVCEYIMVSGKYWVMEVYTIGQMLTPHLNLHL